MRRKLGRPMERLGGYMMFAGGVSIAIIFLIVLVNGSWPSFLEPVQNAARGIGDTVGDLVWLFWVAAFIGPGFIVQQIGIKIGRS